MLGHPPSRPLGPQVLARATRCTGNSGAGSNPLSKARAECWPRGRMVSVLPVPGGPSMTDTERVSASSTARRWLRLQRKGKIGALVSSRDSTGASRSAGVPHQTRPCSQLAAQPACLREESARSRHRSCSHGVVALDDDHLSADGPMALDLTRPVGWRVASTGEGQHAFAPRIEHDGPPEKIEQLESIHTTPGVPAALYRLDGNLGPSAPQRVSSADRPGAGLSPRSPRRTRAGRPRLGPRRVSLRT